MNVLVTGGAGYIGSHMVQMLLEDGNTITTFDNLSTGFRESVTGGEFIEGDLSDRNKLDQLFSTHSFDSVIHFAAYSQVAESTLHPSRYYQNNICNTLNLLDVMVKYDVEHIIFSSTAALFGNPQYTPIDEQHPCRPINPYGHSKLIIEQALENYRQSYGIEYISLRYFNAAGASLDSTIGERHNPETHLIPIVLQVASGKREHIKIFGTDYNTHDGTCIRDYIHVLDLCRAHLLALKHLKNGNPSDTFNLGNSQGYSVKEIIETARQVTQQPIKTIFAPRRPGDPDQLIADSKKINSKMGWSPVHSQIEAIIQHAWQWEQRKLS